MFIDNTLQKALLISLGIHATCLIAVPQIKHFNMQKKFDKIEIVYVKPQEQKIKKTEARSVIKNNLPPPPAYPKREEVVKNSLAQINKPEIKITQDNLGASKPKISLPPVNSKEIRSPEYLNYYQIIREKIKRAAYQGYTKQDTGEVYISFAISSGGSLEGVRLIEEKSTQNQYLRDIALKSIQNASPFPSFPKELNYPQLSFNIIISFETDN